MARGRAPGIRLGTIYVTLAAMLLLAWGAISAALAQSSSLSWAIKATYLYKFAPFVEWPAGSFASPAAPLVLCVVGEDPFGDLLDRAVAGQLVGEHPIILRRLRSVDRNSGCHILYAAGSAAQPIDDILRAVRGAPVLTTTDAASDPNFAGIVHFIIVDNRVRFEIDAAAAAANGLAISSKLLTLAVNVRSP